MGKPFEVKEFDSIICNADYKDDEKYKYLNQKEFDNLVAFIHEFTGDADKLTLYLGAGVTVRGAFARIVKSGREDCAGTEQGGKG